MRVLFNFMVDLGQVVEYAIHQLFGKPALRQSIDGGGKPAFGFVSVTALFKTEMTFAFNQPIMFPIAADGVSPVFRFADLDHIENLQGRFPGITTFIGHFFFKPGVAGRSFRGG